MANPVDVCLSNGLCGYLHGSGYAGSPECPCVYGSPGYMDLQGVLAIYGANRQKREFLCCARVLATLDRMVAGAIRGARQGVDVR